MSRVSSVVVRSAFLSLLSLVAIGVASALASTDVGSIHFTLGYKNLSGDSNLGERLNGLGHQVDAWTTGDTLPKERVYQPALGLEGTWGRKTWPVQIAFDVWNSADDSFLPGHPKNFTDPAYNLRLRANTLELGLGARRAFDLKLITPYIGAGGLWTREKIEVEVSDPNAGQFGAPTGHAHMHTSAFGYWISGGVCRQLGPRFQLGLAYRFSKATLPAEAFTVDRGSLPTEITAFPGYDVFTLDGNGRPVQLLLPNAEGGGRTIHLVVGWSFPSH
jgi:opacity protein-like surface antigen